MKYRIPFDNSDQRTSIRKWVGRTRGASILRTNEDWTYEESGSMIWGSSYIIEAKTGKTELLLKLQFPLATMHNKTNTVLDTLDDVYFPGR